MNDSSWRSLSAILGVACVILIFAAGALLATNGGASTNSPAGGSGASLPASTGSTSGQSPSGSTGSPGGSPHPSGTPVPKAPIANVTFTNMELDASTDLKGTARTFTFVTDGTGPVGISILKATPAMVKACAKVDDSGWDCRYGGKIVFTGALTDTAHSVWQITLQGRNSSTAVVDLALSWPTFHPSITFSHGRLQGSTSPGIPEALNGFTATVKTRSDGQVGLAASWTQTKSDVSVTLDNVTSSPAQTVDNKHYTALSDLGLPGYTFGVTSGQFYKLSFRDLSPDSLRPDLRAVLSFP